MYFSYTTIILVVLTIFFGACQQKQKFIDLNIDSKKKRSEKSVLLKEKNIINEKYQYPIGAPKIVSDYGSWTGVNGKKRKVPPSGC